MYSHVACDVTCVMKERTLYLLKPSSLIWHLMPYHFLFNEGSWKICFNLQLAYQIMNRYKSALFSFILLRNKAENKINN